MGLNQLTWDKWKIIQRLFFFFARSQAVISLLLVVEEQKFGFKCLLASRSDFVGVITFILYSFELLFILFKVLLLALPLMFGTHFYLAKVVVK